MVVRVDVAPAVLQWAVERAGWDEMTTERRAPYLPEWTAGTRRPTLKQMQKFASDTHVPFGVLFLESPPVDEVPIPDLRTIGNAVVPRPSSDLIDTIHICQRRQAWYREYAREQGLPEVDFVGTARTDQEPSMVAAEIRNRLGFELTERNLFSSWEDALRQLIDRAEAVGVLVMVNGVVGSNTHRKLDPQEFRGFALADPIAPLVFVNGADTKAAQIFTLFHELAHIWLGHSAVSDASMIARNGAEEELWCNRVAAEVLVPAASLRGEFGGETTVDELERLARRYRVSTLVVLKRLFDARFLTWEEFRGRYEQERERVLALVDASRGEGRSGGNYYYTQPLRVSRRFAQAVINSALEGSTAYRDAYELLGTKRAETFEHLAEELGVA